MRCAFLRLVALVAAGLAGGELCAQPGANYQPSGPYPTAPARGGAVQALFTTPFGGGGSSDYVNAHGDSVVMPASYYGGAPGPYGGCECSGGCGPYPPCADGGCYGGGPECYGYAGGYGGDCGCDPYGQCNGMGTYPPYEDGLENFSLLPPGRTEQCGPHYFDVRMEAVVMTRDEAFRDQVNFTSNNVFDPNMPNPEQLVLRSNQLDFDYEGGFRILGRYDIGALTVIEFGYWGLENLDASASFTDPNPVDPNTGNLFSLFSFYGNQPAGVTTADGPIPWTERSVTQSISLESELHNAEFNCRRYWVGFNPAVSGTMLAGFRFTRMREDFLFSAQGEATGEYLESIKNDMAGFQTGGDVWLHIRQGLRIGAEGKVGLVNNHYTLTNSFTGTPPTVNGSPDPNFTEHFEKDQPALIVDASADVVWDVCPSWSIRAGYEILFLNSVLLAGENFNTGSVYNRVDGPDFGVVGPERVPFMNDQGDAFYHGGHLGLEYVW